MFKFRKGICPNRLKSKPPSPSILPGGAKISDLLRFFRPPTLFTSWGPLPLALQLLRARRPCAGPENCARLSWTAYGQRRRASFSGQQAFVSVPVDSLAEHSFL